MDLRAAVSQGQAEVLDDLLRLIEVPSVSSMAEHAEDVLTAAELVKEMLTAVGCPTVRFLEAGGKPAVYGHFPAPAGAKTVLLYAHYDVQPAGSADDWSSPAFAPTERAGRLYARGAADDKGGIAVHLGALRALRGQLGVGVKVFIEGEEEIGSPSMPALLAKYQEELSADVFVIADAVNWQVGEPALTTTLRGTVDAVVTVSTLETGLHSGQFGGIVPDALTTLCRLLATLHDDRGNVAIKGLEVGDEPEVDYDEERLLAETGKLEGVEWIGDGKATAKLWSKPAASVLAIDTTSVKDASNTLLPAARAKVSVRIAPGEDPVHATEALREHLLSAAPWGAKVEVAPGQAGAGTVLHLEGRVAELAGEAFEEAFGRKPVEIGTGGSIPIVAEFAKLNPAASILLTAVVDPNSRMHGIDESLELADLHKAVLAEALFLSRLAG